MRNKKEFIEFLKSRNLAEKHNVGEILRYDFDKDAHVYELKLDGVKDNFYLDGFDLIAAFSAGVRAANKAKKPKSSET